MIRCDKCRAEMVRPGKSKKEQQAIGQTWLFQCPKCSELKLVTRVVYQGGIDISKVPEKRLREVFGNDYDELFGSNEEEAS